MTSEGTANPTKQHLLHVDKSKSRLGAGVGGGGRCQRSSNCFMKDHQDVAEPQKSGRSRRTVRQCSAGARRRIRESMRNRETLETRQKIHYQNCGTWSLRARSQRREIKIPDKLPPQQFSNPCHHFHCECFASGHHQLFPELLGQTLH